MSNIRYINWDHVEWSRKFKRILNDILYSRRIYVNDLAKRFGIPPDRVYKWVNPENPFNNFPAFLISEFTKKVGKELLEYIANENGFLLVPEPETEPLRAQISPKEALLSVTTALRESTECLSKFAEVIADGKVTKAEMKQFKKEYDEALTALAKLKSIVDYFADKGERRNVKTST